MTVGANCVRPRAFAERPYKKEEGAAGDNHRPTDKISISTVGATIGRPSIQTEKRTKNTVLRQNRNSPVRTVREACPYSAMRTRQRPYDGTRVSQNKK